MIVSIVCECSGSPRYLQDISLLGFEHKPYEQGPHTKCIWSIKPIYMTKEKKKTTQMYSMWEMGIGFWLVPKEYIAHFSFRLNLCGLHKGDVEDRQIFIWSDLIMLYKHKK